MNQINQQCYIHNFLKRQPKKWLKNDLICTQTKCFCNYISECMVWMVMLVAIQRNSNKFSLFFLIVCMNTVDKHTQSVWKFCGESMCGIKTKMDTNLSAGYNYSRTCLSLYTRPYPFRFNISSLFAYTFAHERMHVCVFRT